MLGTDLRGANLDRCRVYGLSAWDLRFDKDTEQQQLVVRYRPRTSRPSKAQANRGDREHLDAGEEEVIVEGLDVAAFMYLTLNNRNISRIIEAAAKHWVLLLGRFTERKEVLETIAQHVKARQLTPIIFDFPGPTQHDLLETVMLLGGMSRCVIVELTNPRSAPMELQAIASNYGVPIFPVMRRGAREVATLSGLRKFPWVQSTIAYRSMNDLIRQLNQSALASSQPRRVLASR
jgi:hypothetical protein